MLEEIRLILAEQGKAAGRLSLDDALDAELGLSSADLLRLVSKLTERLRTDPFERSASITDVRTAGDLCRLYQDLLSGAAGGSSRDRLPARGRPAPGTRTGPA